MGVGALNACVCVCVCVCVHTFIYIRIYIRGFKSRHAIVSVWKWLRHVTRFLLHALLFTPLYVTWLFYRWNDSLMWHDSCMCDMTYLSTLEDGMKGLAMTHELFHVWMLWLMSHVKYENPSFFLSFYPGYQYSISAVREGHECGWQGGAPLIVEGGPCVTILTFPTARLIWVMSKLFLLRQLLQLECHIPKSSERGKKQIDLSRVLTFPATLVVATRVPHTKERWKREATDRNQHIVVTLIVVMLLPTHTYAHLLLATQPPVRHQ